MIDADDHYEVARIRGVFTANQFQQLLPQHQKIIGRILAEVMKLGEAEARVEHAIKNAIPEADGQAAYDTSVLGRQPHQTFLIDGPKGSGKSTLLLNLRGALEQVGPRDLIKRPSTAFPIKGLEDQFPEHFEDLTDFQALSVAGKTRRLVHALPVIKPDAMETSESIIESVFAEMTGQFEFVENSGRRGMSASDWPDQTSQFDPRIQRAEQLKKELHSEVAKGWYFARQLGVEALMNDSMNFDEYITRRASEAVVSHKRVSRWMKYVSAYLDFFDAELLAIFIDDTDVSSDLTADVLHTIRMFFCHPRIVVLMAGNLHTMRQRLLARAMSEQSDAHRTLRAGHSFTAKFWRDFERDNLEEYFSKVLPVSYRHFISTSGTDTEHLLSTQTFVTFCGSQMNSRMEEFLKERRTTRMRNEGDAQIRSARYEQLLDLAQQENRFHVESENHIALWLLRNHYAKVLTPKTARHLNQFREMVERKADESGQKSISDSLSSSRRVVVALFTQPNNYTIIQRQSDFDNDALLWINRQTVKSGWRGARWIGLNELVLPYGTPSYEYVLYRLDVEIAKPSASRQNPNIPTSLLPEPSGRKIWAPELWQTDTREPQRTYLGLHEAGDNQWQFVRLPNHELRLRQELHGLARAFSSPVIPTNCIFFKDLRGIPDLAWTWDEKQDSDHLRFFDQFIVRNIDNSFRLDRYDPRNDYFRNVVLVFASYPLVQPVPSEEFVTDSAPLHELELNDFADLLRHERQTTPFANIKEISVAVAEMYQTALSGIGKPVLRAGAGIIHQLGPHRIARHLKRKRMIAAATSGTEAEPRLDLSIDEIEAGQRVISKIIPRYHRILNDTRRAYHAMRILEQDINNYSFIARAEGNADVSRSRLSQTISWPSPFTHSRNDRYTLMSLNKFRATIGLPTIVQSSRAETTGRAVDPSIQSQTWVADTRYWTPISRDAHGAHGPYLEQPFSSTVRETFPVGNPFGVLWIGKFDSRRRTGLADEDDKRRQEEKADHEREPAVWSWKLEYSRPELDHSRSLASRKEHLFGERTWRLTTRGEDAATAELREASTFSMLVADLPSVASLNSAIATPDLHSLGKHLLDTSSQGQAERSRALRSILLYIWGLAPCLSSLIHLETMGLHYWWQEWLDAMRKKNADTTADAQGVTERDLAQTTEKYLEEIAERLDDWEMTIAYAILSVICFSTALEANLHRDFDALKKHEDKTPDFVAFSPLPDVSIATLGLRLYTDDDERAWEDIFKETRKFAGVLGDVLLRLQLAHYYIAELRKSFGSLFSEQLDKQSATVNDTAGDAGPLSAEGGYSGS